MSIIDILLKNRGLNTAVAVDEFFRPAKPQTIKFSAVRAVSVIRRAIKAGRPVFIYGDYDADGITATAVLWETLHRLKARVMPYICPRNDPVRGLSVNGLKTFPTDSLVITVDNGITAFTAAEFAADNRIELIITDHHQAGKKLPKAAAVVHDTRLAGVGVAWFLARELGGGGLDLAALGTIADMVPLLGPNRSLVKFGLDQLRRSSRPGIKILADQAQIPLDQLTTHQVSFSLAPRLNAMARLDDSLEALRLLCTPDRGRAAAIGEKLAKINQQRQDQTAIMSASARKQVDSKSKLIYVQSRDYHEGLVGLVAGRLAEEFSRPAVVVAVGPKHAKGSIRSGKNFDAIGSLRKIADLLMEHGGHPQAAGFTASISQLPRIRKKLEAAAAGLSEKDLVAQPNYEAELPLAGINRDLYQQLRRFEPFGFGNPVPVFLAKQEKVNSFYPVGADNKHLKLKINNFNAIAFGQGQLAAKLKTGQPLDLTYSIEENHFRGRTSLQLKINEFI